jgi:hypothetical protein
MRKELIKYTTDVETAPEWKPPKRPTYIMIDMILAIETLRAMPFFSQLDTESRVNVAKK